MHEIIQHAFAGGEKMQDFYSKLFHISLNISS